VIFSPIINK